MSQGQASEYLDARTVYQRARLAHWNETARLSDRGMGWGGYYRRRLATVYRALQGLVDSRRVDVFRRETGEALFRLCNPVHHHHLVCQRCGRVVEIDACGVELWASRVAHRHGFTITDHQADVFGVCAACQTSS